MIIGIDKVERLSKGSKWMRMMYNPFKYMYAIAYRTFIYPKKKEPVIVNSQLFWGLPMTMALPSATDIYLTGGKTHESEIRLVKFMQQFLSVDAVFLDIGAHYGYFSLIAAQIASKGSVYAFEPTTFSFKIIEQNAKLFPHLEALNLAMSDEEKVITFYEFDNQYSEYNTGDISQFLEEEWFKNHPPQKVDIQGTTISAFCMQNNIVPQLIKIDVEGLEDIVITGAMKWMQMSAHHRPTIVMEYLSEERSNATHKKAVSLLRSVGYTTYVITNEGKLQACEQVDDYLKTHQIDSENIVFKFD